MTHTNDPIDPSRGQQIELDGMFDMYLRPICPADQALIAEGIMDLSHEARRMRFFGDFSEVPEPLVRDLSNADGVTHIAWGALDVTCGRNRPAAAVHAIRQSVLDTVVELAVTVIDAYQGHGLAKVLMAAVLQDCQALGIRTARAEVLSGNVKAQQLFLGLGAKRIRAGQEHVLEMDVAQTLARLNRPGCPRARADLLAHIRQQARLTRGHRAQAANPMR